MTSEKTNELVDDFIIGHYRIISKIGAGGMSEVYLAEDTKLHRKVALKILPAEFAADLDRMERFVREARAASALNHPNILTIHEIGESDATHFIATEFIDGKTLNEYVKSNSLNLKSILEIAVQIASALDEAHAAGIVHRDIKPDNVMVRSNDLVKILDFGIAKLAETTPANLSSEDATAIKPQSTSPGMIIGTANYMSPEQANGKEVDARTDIFSFGIVLYEMMAGGLPFAGENALSMIGAILHQEPKQLSADVPPEIAKIIGKCLRKDRNERYQTIKDVGNDLKEVKQELEFQNKLERTVSPNRAEPKTQILQATTADEINQTTTNQTVSNDPRTKYLLIGLLSLIVLVGGFFAYRSFTPNKQINSIAVLPFENKSSDADTDYLSDGLAESLIYRLSQIPDLKVSPTSSVFRYKGKATNPQTVAKELGVDSVMTGRITQRGDNLTISVNLVDMRNGKSLWGEQYERKMSELLATQREIAAEITNNLKIKLSGEGEQKLAKKYTENNEAYQAYLKGRYYWKKRGGKNLAAGIGYFQQAINIDPNFALAWSGLADSYSLLPEYTATAQSEALPKSKQAAQTAIELDPELAEAHASLGYINFSYEWDFTAAEREFRKAIGLNPNYATAHQWYAEMLATTGRSDEAITHARKAVELEPLSALQKYIYGYVLISARRHTEAAKQLDAGLELDPDFARLQANKSAMKEAVKHRV